MTSVAVNANAAPKQAAATGSSSITHLSPPANGLSIDDESPRQEAKFDPVEAVAAVPLLKTERGRKMFAEFDDQQKWTPRFDPAPNMLLSQMEFFRHNPGLEKNMANKAKGDKKGTDASKSAQRGRSASISVPAGSGSSNPEAAAAAAAVVKAANEKAAQAKVAAANAAQKEKEKEKNVEPAPTHKRRNSNAENTVLQPLAPSGAKLAAAVKQEVKAVPAQVDNKPKKMGHNRSQSVPSVPNPYLTDERPGTAAGKPQQPKSGHPLPPISGVKAFAGPSDSNTSRPTTSAGAGPGKPPLTGRRPSLPQAVVQPVRGAIKA